MEAAIEASFENEAKFGTPTPINSVIDCSINVGPIVLRFAAVAVGRDSSPEGGSRCKADITMLV